MIICKLKEKREAAGLTQQELAEKAGVHQSQIALWEGGFNPRFDNMDRIAQTLKLQPGEIWVWEPENLTTGDW